MLWVQAWDRLMTPLGATEPVLVPDSHSAHLRPSDIDRWEKERFRDDRDVRRHGAPYERELAGVWRSLEESGGESIGIAGSLDVPDPPAWAQARMERGWQPPSSGELRGPPYRHAMVPDRLWAEWLAKVRGFFWGPCPICGELFAGFEWGRASLMRNRAGGTGVCSRPECEVEADRRNADLQAKWESGEVDGGAVPVVTISLAPPKEDAS